jgi:hypothetical protein
VGPRWTIGTKILAAARGLRMNLNYRKESWPLGEEQCPCDVHFFDYCREDAVRGQAIFHFGTGEHHYLGIRNQELAPPNAIFAVTASREEYAAYIELIIRNPQVANYYKVLFCDIYTLAPRSVPRFDLVTLFHLCEFYSEANRAYARGDDGSVLEMFLEQLYPGGQLLFYRGSCRYRAAKVLVDRLAREGRIAWLMDYKTITSYRKVERSQERSPESGRTPSDRGGSMDSG